MKYLLVLLTATLLWSCSQEKEAPLEQLNKKSAREVTLMTVKSGDSVYHITRQFIWFNGQKIAEKQDTIVTANKVNTWDTEAQKSSLGEIPIYVTVQ